MSKVIVVENLQKVYKPKSRKQALDVRAVDGISFEIERGEFFGLLGPNEPAFRVVHVSWVAPV